MKHLITIIFLSQLFSQDIGQKMIENGDYDSAIKYYQFLLNDEKKSVSITTPGGRSIVINDDEEEIHVDDNGTSSVSLTSDGIALDSSGAITIQAKGDLNLEGQNISIKALQELKAEGAAGAELSTSAIAILKGSLVQIN